MPAQQVGAAWGDALYPTGALDAGTECGNLNASQVSGLPEIVRTAAMLDSGEAAGNDKGSRGEMVG